MAKKTKAKKRKNKRVSLAQELGQSSQARAVQAYRERLTRAIRSKFPLEPMSADEYQMAIDYLGFTQEEAGVWLGLSSRQGQRYGSGGVEIPGPVAKLLRLMVRQKLKPEAV